VLRRAQNSGNVFQQSVFHHGNLKIDFARAEVFKDERMVFLSATEYRLLLQLARNLGKVLPSEQLLADVWGAEYRDDKEILWVSISRLRQKLEDDPRNPVHIVTRPGLGYSMPPFQE
jgi:DNA-binding response OmpR family regulator